MFASVTRGEIPPIVPFYCPVPTNFDPSLAPPGHQLLTVCAVAPTSDVTLKDPGPAWEEAMLRTIRRVVPRLDENVLFVDRFSVDFIEKWIGKEFGPAVSTAQTPDQVGPARPPVYAPVRGPLLRRLQRGGARRGDGARGGERDGVRRSDPRRTSGRDLAPAATRDGASRRRVVAHGHGRAAAGVGDARVRTPRPRPVLVPHHRLRSRRPRPPTSTSTPTPTPTPTSTPTPPSTSPSTPTFTPAPAPTRTAPSPPPPPPLDLDAGTLACKPLRPVYIDPSFIAPVVLRINDHGPAPVAQLVFNDTGIPQIVTVPTTPDADASDARPRV